MKWSILGLYWDNGKENGNYYSILGIPSKVFIGVIFRLCPGGLRAFGSSRATVYHDFPCPQHQEFASHKHVESLGWGPWR